MSYKEVLGIITAVIALTSYSLYFKSVIFGNTKPHVFSWFIWGLITAIGFAGQIAAGAGAGAWATGATALGCFTISILAWVKGGRINIVFLDWVSLMGAGFALLLWYLTNNPLLSIILVVLIDALGFVPTFRKSFIKPFEESITMFSLSGFKFLLALFALETFSLTTALLPLYLVIANWTFVGMVIIRRKQLS